MFTRKVISTEFDKLKHRIVKVLGLGSRDVQTGKEASPFGIDSNPVKDMIAIYAQTSVKGKTFVIGYLNVNQLAAVGEIRLFSTDKEGDLKISVWLKNDGTIEIGGNTKNMVRYQELESGFNALKEDHNKLVDAFNAHMHATAATGPPSTPTPGIGIPAQPSTADISGSKIDEIKTL